MALQTIERRRGGTSERGGEGWVSRRGQPGGFGGGPETGLLTPGPSPASVGFRRHPGESSEVPVTWRLGDARSLLVMFHETRDSGWCTKCRAVGGLA
jgi:hypothetical protein